MAKDLFGTERFDELAGGRQAALPLPLPSEAEEAAERMRTPEHPAAANTPRFDSWAEAAAANSGRQIGDGSRTPRAGDVWAGPGGQPRNVRAVSGGFVEYEAGATVALQSLSMFVRNCTLAR